MTTELTTIERESSGRTFAILLFVVLVLRFLAFPFTDVTNEGDSVSRTLMAWGWLEHPYFFDCAGYPPLHLYLVGASLWLWFDPVRTPAVVHMLISIATAIPLWGFARREWGESGGLFVAAAFLFYPLAWHLSFMPASETVFVFFVALGIYFLSRARASSNQGDAICAGIAMTLAAAVRMEGWAVAPVFSIVFFRRWKMFITYLICAGLFPVFCAADNFLHGLHPISYFTALRDWELKSEGINEGRNAYEIIRRIVYYPSMIFFGLTPPVGLLTFIGLKIAWKDPSKRIWFIPTFLILLIFIVQVVRGLGATTARFSLLLGLLFVPFSAAAIQKFRAKAWLKPLAIVSILLMLPLSYSRIVLYRLGGPTFPNPFPADLQALPKVKPESKEIAKIAGSQLQNRNEGLVLDFFGKDFYPWKDTYAVALLSRTHPSSIFFMPGGRYQPLDENALDRFLNEHPRGVLLYERESRMIHLRQSNDSTTAAIGRSHLVLQTVNSVKSITIYRYEVL